MLGIAEEVVSVITLGGCAALASLLVVATVWFFMARRRSALVQGPAVWGSCAIPALLGIWGAYISIADTREITDLMRFGAASPEQLALWTAGAWHGARQSLLIGVLASCPLLAWLIVLRWRSKGKPLQPDGAGP